MFAPLSSSCLSSMTTPLDFDSKGSAAPVDPYWANTVLLLQGSNVSDKTGRHVVNQNDGLVTNSGGLLVFDGGSSLRIQDGMTDFLLDGQFTIEGWAQSSFGSTQILLATLASGLPSGTWEIYNRNPTNIGMYSQGSDIGFEQSGVTDHSATPVHWSIGRNASNTVVVYVGGVQVNTFPASGSIGTGLEPLYIGREGTYGTRFFTGSQSIRITKGVNRYTSGTINPPFAFPTS